MEHFTKSAPSDIEARPYIAGLDGLRAIAVITVFLGHAFTNVIANAVGVDMFFALSGFLITRGLVAQLGL
jgi:peptidoglycan/LPS O-acetylase OafA/YrhL